MINFRFHLVSLVAVFLALALGVVVGSTLVDRAIVDGLRTRIDEVERNADTTEAANRDLRGDLERADGYAGDVLPFLVGGRLRNVDMVMVAVRGVDDKVVRDMAQTLRVAGARVPGVLWLEPSLSSKDQRTRERLAQAVTDPYRQGENLRSAALEALGRRLALGPAAPN
ncbi:MAG: copper transporter, partial [Acidimicrobiia bacterium]